MSILAPASNSILLTSIAGDSLESFVFGLNAHPK